MSEQIQRSEPASLGVLSLSDSQWERFKTSMAMLVSGGGEFLPDGMKSIAQAQAAALVCMGLGLDPVAMIGGKKVWVVQGRVAFHYNVILGQCMKYLPGFRHEVLEHDEKHCIARFRRSADHPWHTISYSLEDAKRAGLLKDGSNWAKSPKDMLLSKVIHRGCNAVAADVLAGLPPETEDDLADMASVASQPASGSIAEVVDSLGESIMQQGAEPEPEPVASNTAKAAFWSSAAKAGWSASGKTMHALLKELLTVEGVVPQWKSVDELAVQDWRIATLRLSERYPNGKPADWPKNKWAPAAAEPTVEVQPDHDEAPPPTVEDEPSPADEAAESGADILRAQMSDVQYLRDLCADVTRTTRSQMLSGDGQWFVHGSILRACGFVDEKGAPTPLSLVPHPKFGAAPDQVYALSMQVKSVLDTFKNRGVTPIARRSENT